MRSDVNADQVIELNRRFHDEVEATTYDTRMGVAHSPADVLRTVTELERVLGRSLPSGGICVDLGAGTGNLAVKLALSARFREVIAVDVSARMLEQAAAAARQHGCAISTVVSDMRPLPFADASVDVVVGCAVLHHVADVQALMQDVRRVLKPEGVCVFIGEPSQWGGRLTHMLKLPLIAAARLRRLIASSAAKPRWDHEHIDVHTFTLGDVHALTAGFARVRLQPEGLLEPVVDQALLAPAQLIFGEREGFRSACQMLRQHLAQTDRVLSPWLPGSALVSIKFAAERS